MMAFVADMPVRLRRRPRPRPRRPRSRSRQRRNPRPQYNRISSSRHSKPAEIAALPEDEASDTGVPGGVEGGIPGGVGGVVGGLPEAPPPLPRAPTPAPRTPVRIGGQIKQPQLLKRIEPGTRRSQSRHTFKASSSWSQPSTRTARSPKWASEVCKSAARLGSRNRAAAMALFTARPQRTHVPFVLTVTLSFFLEAFSQEESPWPGSQSPRGNRHGSANGAGPVSGAIDEAQQPESVWVCVGTRQRRRLAEHTYDHCPTGSRMNFGRTSGSSGRSSR